MTDMTGVITQCDVAIFTEEEGLDHDQDLVASLPEEVRWYDPIQEGSLCSAGLGVHPKRLLYTSYPDWYLRFDGRDNLCRNLYVSRNTRVSFNGTLVDQAGTYLDRL